ncbi:MAG: mycofactocin glycosyltransferase [Thermoleophilaceae bacterium]|jgi:glycosyltransferase involved in cell wall biosynthesis|nr:mycofactocin glycosyltransferase [Thermoleophilaceae bacterium]
MPDVPALQPRPAIDVVVPFAGPMHQLRALRERLGLLALVAGDTLTIVDNRPPGADPFEGALPARERQSSYYARNRGAANGSNSWIEFLDADVEPPPDLLERLFADPPDERTAVLAGGVVDEPQDDGSRQPPATRFAMLSASMSQSNTLLPGPWAYAQTANCAVRRAAFEDVGGFRDDLRSGGDADLCFRLRAAGWELEARDEAAVIHRSRRSMRKLLRQRARHGSGAAWLQRHYPGASPRASSWAGLIKWTLTSFGAAALARLRGREDDALVRFVEPLWMWAFELGRLFPNEVRER